MVEFITTGDVDYGAFPTVELGSQEKKGGQPGLDSPRCTPNHFSPPLSTHALTFPHLQNQCFQLENQVYKSMYLSRDVLVQCPEKETRSSIHTYIITSLQLISAENKFCYYAILFFEMRCISQAFFIHHLISMTRQAFMFSFPLKTMPFVELIRAHSTHLVFLFKTCSSYYHGLYTLLNPQNYLCHAVQDC